MAASSLLPGLAVLLLGVGLIYSSLMILIRSRMLFRRTFWMPITSGIRQALVNVYNQVVR